MKGLTSWLCHKPTTNPGEKLRFHRPPTRILAVLGSVLFVGSFLLSAGPLRATAVIVCGPSPIPQVQLATVSNEIAVIPGVTTPSEFTVASGSVTVLSLATYHYLLPRGMSSTGMVGLRSSDGRAYGPWQTIGKPGASDIANAIWYAAVDVVLPAGTYTVTDSDPYTWSVNDGTRGAGMFWVTGYQDNGVMMAVAPVAPVQLYTISNQDSVQPGATAPSRFTVASGSVNIRSLTTYHSLSSHALSSTGQVSLRDANGKTYGPWQTIGRTGAGDRANAIWFAPIDVVLPAGTYTVIDSDPYTWSANAGTGGAGMFWVTGYQK